MKKRICTTVGAKGSALLLALACLALCLGCGANGLGKGLAVSADGAVNVMILSLPQSENRARNYSTQEKIQLVTEYLSGLTLQKQFSENPDDYTGETLVINVSYDDGTKRTFYHFGNLFIKEGTGPWMRMDYQEAEALDTLINQNPSD